MTGDVRGYIASMSGSKMCHTHYLWGHREGAVKLGKCVDTTALTRSPESLIGKEVSLRFIEAHLTGFTGAIA